MHSPRAISLARYWSLVRKEFIHIRRDPRSLAMAFLMPVILLVLFGYAITLDIENLDLAVIDQDRSPVSREYIRRFEASGYFTIVARPLDYRATERLLDAGRVHLALVIPPNFGRDLEARDTVAVQSLIDGSDANTATIALGYVAGVTERFNADQLGRRVEPAVQTRLRVWYNPELESRWFIIPGLIAVIMTTITALLTSLTIAREWEQGTMEQLVATPVRGIELIVGKMTPYFLIGMADLVVAVAMAVWVFEVPLRGNLPFVMGSGALFMAGGLGLGILISTVAKSQLVASQVAMVLTLIPALLLSGFLYSIDNMPRPLQVLTHAVQARYYVSILKTAFLKGSPPAYLATELWFLTLFAAVVLTLAIAAFRKRLS